MRLPLGVRVQWARLPARTRWYGVRLAPVPVWVAAAALWATSGEWAAALACTSAAFVTGVSVQTSVFAYRAGFLSALNDVHAVTHGETRPPRFDPWDTTPPIEVDQ